jgi:hypothetical protein
MTASDCTRRYRRRRKQDVACFGVEAPWHELGVGLMRLGYLQPLDVPPHGIGHKLTADERAALTQALNEFVWRELCGFGPPEAA